MHLGPLLDNDERIIEKYNAFLRKTGQRPPDLSSKHSKDCQCFSGIWCAQQAYLKVIENLRGFDAFSEPRLGEVQHSKDCLCSGSWCGHQRRFETLENLMSASGSYCGYDIHVADCGEEREVQHDEECNCRKCWLYKQTGEYKQAEEQKQAKEYKQTLVVNLEEEITHWPKYSRWTPYERTVLDRPPPTHWAEFKDFLGVLWEVFLDNVPFVRV